MHAHRLVVAVVGMAAITCCVQAQAAFTPETTNSEYSVVVHYGKDITVSEAIAQKLQSDVLEMMKTANYNSRMPHRGVWQHAESISEITRRYRDVVANGKYVLIVWGHPQKVQSVIGERSSLDTLIFEFAYKCVGFVRRGHVAEGHVCNLRDYECVLVYRENGLPRGVLIR